MKRLRLVSALGLLLALGACDANIVLWPWSQEKADGADPAPAQPATPSPSEVPVDLPPMGTTPTGVVPDDVPNPNANNGAPVDGTPFPDAPLNPDLPLAEEIAPPVSGATGQPVEPTPVVETPVAPQPETPAPAPAPAPAPQQPTPVAETPAAPEPAAPAPAPAIKPKFYYHPVGKLEPASGIGTKETKIFAPNMVFPILDAPAYPQSQVYRYGGGVKGGDQCDKRNFQAPWRDNYCENRSNSSTTPWCEDKGLHLGQDIRVGTPEGCAAERKTKAADRTRYAVVAVEDGEISNIGSYTVNLRANGRIYRYLHLNMSKLKVSLGQKVKAGDIIGYVSNDFGGTATTLHLHFEIKVNTAEHGWVYAPPYSSLLAAYQRREQNAGEEVADNPQVAVAFARRASKPPQ